MSRFFPVGDGRKSGLPRRTALFTALPAALLLAGSGALLAPSMASAAPGDDITDSCLEMSQNGGPWVAPGPAFIPVGTGYIPVPGDEGTVLTFDVRNICDVPATLTLFSEEWSVTQNGNATVRGEISGQKGQQFVIGAGKDATTRLELARKPVTTNVGVKVGFVLGLPASEVVQGNEINGGWGLVLVEDELVVAPAAPTGLTLDAAEVEAGTPVKVSGKAEPGSNVTVSGGGATCTATPDTNGNFSCDLTIAAVGDHPITATASNAGGTGAVSTPVTVKVVAESTDPGGSSGSSTGSLGSLDIFGS